MRQKDFLHLLKGIEQMRCILRGEQVPGARVTDVQRVRGKLVRTRLK